MVDEEAGYVLTGKGYKPLVPEDLSKTYKAILEDIPEVEDPALLPEKVAQATIEYYRVKGMIPDNSTSVEDLQQQCSYNPDDPMNGSDSLPTIKKETLGKQRYLSAEEHIQQLTSDPDRVIVADSDPEHATKILAQMNEIQAPVSKILFLNLFVKMSKRMPKPCARVGESMTMAIGNLRIRALNLGKISPVV